MIVYRYIKFKYLDDPLSTEGAKKVGGRWNPAGVPVLYCSDQPSTAQLEILAMVNEIEVLSEFTLVCIELPDDFMVIDQKSLLDVQKKRKDATSWDSPVHPEYTREIGEVWVSEQEALALLVPSSLCPFNY